MKKDGSTIILQIKKVHILIGLQKKVFNLIDKWNSSSSSNNKHNLLLVKERVEEEEEEEELKLRHELPLPQDLLLHKAEELEEKKEGKREQNYERKRIEKQNGNNEKLFLFDHQKRFFKNKTKTAKFWYLDKKTNKNKTKTTNIVFFFFLKKFYKKKKKKKKNFIFVMQSEKNSNGKE